MGEIISIARTARLLSVEPPPGRMDPRITAYAHVLTTAITIPKKGSILVVIPASESNLAKEITRMILARDAFPHIHVYHDEYPYDHTFLTHAAEDLLAREPATHRALTQATDGRIMIRTPTNTRAFTSVDPRRLALAERAMHGIQRYVVDEQDNWVLGMSPNNALAQDAEMSLAEYEDFFYDAVLQDWEQQRAFQERLKALMERTDQVRILGKDTDLRFSIRGKRACPCTGTHNIPDGEVFTEPVKESVEGTIRFSYPAIRKGREVSGIRLGFEKGKAVAIHADKNEEYLKEMLALDEGASYIGEFGIGTNYGISRFTKQILFDEKIGGSIHLALGNAYKTTGGENQSALHWDMILDLRDGGEIRFDETIVQKDGEFRIH